MYKVKKYLSDLVLIFSFLFIGSICFYLYTNGKSAEVRDTAVTVTEVPETFKYGFNEAGHFFEDYPIKRNAFMGDILMDRGIDFDRILELEKKAEKVFSLRKIMAGKSITFIKEDECEAPKCFVYEPNPMSFIRFDLSNEIAVTKVDRDVDVCMQSASGIVTSSLWTSMKKEGLDARLIDKMEDALAQVYFDQSQPGDQYKLIFEMIYVDGKPIRSGKIYSAAYKSDEDINYGFFYANDKYSGYYDFEGTPNKKTFLNAPVKYSYISSGYNPNRFHPILKRRKAHLGTDYAARRGAPIMAVADGVITKRSYTEGNGNYIKIKHDDVYQTQYLHMSKFARGIKPGVRVRQGQTIGYVGSTGLATGPHVCFRFWKNGKQINHRTENFPPLNPMEKSELPTFFKERDNLMQELDEIPFKERNMAYAGFSD